MDATEKAATGIVGAFQSLPTAEVVPLRMRKGK